MNYYYQRCWAPLSRAGIVEPTRRCFTAATWEAKVARPVQTYISTSRDPYLNLSIEHDLLTKSAKDSVVLFLYVNRPSVILGRNQNPWLEVNLPLLAQARQRPETEPPGLGAVDFVRRRSGGGTVFHDEGNVNWTVICPRDQFTRDKHAEMVVRALRKCGVDRARVNERHDIVLDQGQRGEDPDPDDTHTTPYTNPDGPRPLKVSGSAYKITGAHRALHHGTCLLASPNLNIIPDYLHSPAKPFIREARGVQSVSSPVGNILIGNNEFCTAVHEEFLTMYPKSGRLHFEEVADEMLEIKTIGEGAEELKSLKHKYEQTPRFILSNAADQSAPLLLELTIREGKVASGLVSGHKAKEVGDSHFAIGENSSLPKLNELGASSIDPEHTTISWDTVLEHALRNCSPEDRQHLLAWLRRVIKND